MSTVITSSFIFYSPNSCYLRSQRECGGGGHNCLIRLVEPCRELRVITLDKGRGRPQHDPYTCSCASERHHGIRQGICSCWLTQTSAQEGHLATAQPMPSRGRAMLQPLRARMQAGSASSVCRLSSVESAPTLSGGRSPIVAPAPDSDVMPGQTQQGRQSHLRQQREILTDSLGIFG